MGRSWAPMSVGSTWAPGSVCPESGALWGSFRQTGAGTFSLSLSTAVHVVFPWGAACWFGNKDKLSQELFSLCGYCDSGRWKHLPVMERLLWTLKCSPEREREKPPGECIHVSKKRACFQVPRPLQRTRVIKKELVQNGGEQ